METVRRFRIVICLETRNLDPNLAYEMGERANTLIQVIDRNEKLRQSIEGVYVSPTAFGVAEYFYAKVQDDTKCYFGGLAIYLSSSMFIEARAIQAMFAPKVRAVVFASAVRPHDEPMIFYRKEYSPDFSDLAQLTDLDSRINLFTGDDADTREG